MASSSICAPAGAPSGERSRIGAAADAMNYAANAFSREDDFRRPGAADAREQGEIDSAAADMPAVRRPRVALRDTLPEDFVPLREVRDMALLGRWTPLDDRMSPCLPARVVAAMQRRHDLGDQDAAAWLKVHARAYVGDPDAQRLFARVCESGLYRATADLQRAFFWYYRAWLQGDVQARKDVERLMRSTRISAAAMAEPMLVYPGPWRITAHLSDRLDSTTLFELSEDGTASGCLMADSMATSTSSIDTLAAAGDQCSDPACALSMHEARYRGGWAYDGIGHVLTIIFDESASGARRWRSDCWQIALLGCRAGALCGRDRRSVAYTLECLTTSPVAAREAP